MLYILDVEGLLLDSSAAVQYAAEKVRKRNKNLNAPLEEEQVRKVLSGTIEMNHILVEEGADGKTRRDALMLFGRHLDDVFPRFVNVYPEIPQLLAQLKAEGHRLVAFSNRITLFLYQWLYDSNLVQYFDLVVGIDTVPEPLPSEKAITYILSQTQTPLQDAILYAHSLPALESAKLAHIHFHKVEYGNFVADFTKHQTSNIEN